jgi:hypothetical protein
VIFAAEPYIMLMASLPDLGTLLSNRAPPISRVRLEQRLTALDPEDRAELEALRTLLSWSRLDIGDEDAAFVARATKVVGALRSPALRDAASERLEIRTLIAALRRRHRGEDAPAPKTPWGYGRFVETIGANWTAPDFGVGRRFPWLLKAKEKLEAGDAQGLEALVLQTAWASGARHLGDHVFDFEAVAFYVLRWSLIDRWSRYDATAAAARFTELLDAAFADNAQDFLAAA